MFTQLTSIIDTFTETIAKVIAWFTLFMVLIMSAIVILRYGFQVGWIAMQESVLYLHSAVFMLGAAYTLQKDEHVRVDVFYRKFGERKKALVNIFGTIVFLLPVCAYLFYLSWDYVITSWLILEGSKETGGLDGVFLLKSLLLAFSSLLILQGVSLTIKNSLFLISSKEVAK